MVEVGTVLTPETDEEIRKVRALINTLVNTYGVKTEIPGVEIIQTADEFPEGTDCATYVFGSQIDHSDIQTYHRVLEFYEPSTLDDADIAVYVDAISGSPFSHFGKVSRGKIVSKWGLTGNVYRHPPLYVPSWYGDPEYYCLKK